MFRTIPMIVLLFAAGAISSFAAALKPDRIELAEDWKLASATEAKAEGAAISVAGYKDSRWHPIKLMPATVLEILQEEGVYPDLYVGKNLMEKVPQELYKEDWWYRTTFKAPAGECYTLEFPGINYRAEIWINGEKIADNKQVVGMYVAHELNVTQWIKRGSRNVLAVNTRAQFETFAASGWATHKMVAYWMLNSHWPSFYGNLIDYYMSPGGAYYGAKKGLRPLSVVFDYYATGDNSQARIIVFNQTPGEARNLRVRVRIYDLDGKVRADFSTNGIAVPFNGTTQVMTLPRYPESSPVFFVRCQLYDDSGKLVVDNTYWQSQKDDDLGARANDMVMTLRQNKWADMTALNTMPLVPVEITATQSKVGKESHVTIRLRNPSERIAFFERATISTKRDGDEILPILYDDNYVTVFPGETVEIHGVVRKDVKPRWVKLEGYNTPAVSVSIK